MCVFVPAEEVELNHAEDYYVLELLCGMIERTMRDEFRTVFFIRYSKSNKRACCVRQHLLCIPESNKTNQVTFPLYDSPGLYHRLVVGANLNST